MSKNVSIYASKTLMSLTLLDFRQFDENLLQMAENLPILNYYFINNILAKFFQ